MSFYDIVSKESAEEFHDDRKNHDVVVVAFFMIGCPACVQFKPVWDEFTQQHKKKGDSNIVIAEVEKDQMENVDNRYTEGLRGFPSIFAENRKRKELNEFDGPRTVAGLQKFLEAAVKNKKEQNLIKDIKEGKGRMAAKEDLVAFMRNMTSQGGGYSKSTRRSRRKEKRSRRKNKRSRRTFKRIGNIMKKRQQLKRRMTKENCHMRKLKLTKNKLLKKNRRQLLKLSSKLCRAAKHHHKTRNKYKNLKHKSFKIYH